MGLSRDDYTKFSKEYEKLKIFKADPFASIDQEGVGIVIEMAIKLGRKTRKDLEIGICGEHGGEPASVEYCYRAGMNYVSPARPTGSRSPPGRGPSGNLGRRQNRNHANRVSPDRESKLVMSCTRRHVKPASRTDYTIVRLRQQRYRLKPCSRRPASFRVRVLLRRHRRSWPRTPCPLHRSARSCSSRSRT